MRDCFLILILDGLKYDKTPSDPKIHGDVLGRQSRLATLLKLGAEHSGEHEFTTNERTYLQGWRHCLMAMQGKLRSLRLPLTPNNLERFVTN